MRGTNKLLALAALMAAHPAPGHGGAVDFFGHHDDSVEKALRDASRPVWSGSSGRMHLAQLNEWARKRRRARQTHPGKRGKP